MLDDRDDLQTHSNQTLNHRIGWREWMALPELGIPAIKVKADTGARTSAIHAINLQPFTRKGESWIRFDIPPLQRIDSFVITCEAPLIDQRTVTDSGGHSETRYVITTLLRLSGLEKSIELTLTERAAMRFRMLLGRTALTPELIVDPSQSYLLGKARLRKLYPVLKS